VGPFDRFTDRAKRVLALAQDEAIRFNHNYIGPEHLLLGLVREGEGIAARVLGSLGVELTKVRTAVEFRVGRGDATIKPSEITLSPQTRKVIDLANEEAKTLCHGHVGTEHLLLGLLRERGTMATEVLESLGVPLEKARHQVIAVLGQTRAADAGTAQPSAISSTDSPVVRTGPWDRLDEHAIRAVARAYWEAGRTGQVQIAPEHLLLALMASESGWMLRVWKELNVDPYDLTSRISSVASSGKGVGQLTHAPSLTEVMNRATSLAAMRRSMVVRPEHLLLAIVEEGQSLAATWLASVGATGERIRQIIDMKS
jgi:ATP-dependent Clp protease ATP-binding subunit ClpA